MTVLTDSLGLVKFGREGIKKKKPLVVEVKARQETLSDKKVS